MHPVYAEAILDGRKQVEFRRRRFAKDVSIVVVYATKPVCEIVGWFEVDDIVEGTPLSLWRRFSSCSGIDRAAYLRYFDKAARAFGITVRHAVRLERPIKLTDLRPGLRPPQSYQYLSSLAVAGLVD